jgi:hypothetical protein
VFKLALFFLHSAGGFELVGIPLGE